jgi:hypothetical protein
MFYTERAGENIKIEKHLHECKVIHLNITNTKKANGKEDLYCIKDNHMT